MVKAVSLDRTGSMYLMDRKFFPKAVRVIDRFHVQKLNNKAYSISE